MDTFIGTQSAFAIGGEWAFECLMRTELARFNSFAFEEKNIAGYKEFVAFSLPFIQDGVFQLSH